MSTDAILARASEIAQLNNDSSPRSVEWIHTTLGTASDVMGLGVIDASDAQKSGALVVLTGDFTLNERGKSAPGDNAAPMTGSNILVFINDVDSTVSAFKMTSEGVSLAQYGTVFHK